VSTDGHRTGGGDVLIMSKRRFFHKKEKIFSDKEG
jgi:hypothetical protein